jgi:hypothetical protein
MQFYSWLNSDNDICSDFFNSLEYTDGPNLSIRPSIYIYIKTSIKTIENN